MNITEEPVSIGDKTQIGLSSVPSFGRAYIPEIAPDELDKTSASGSPFAATPPKPLIAEKIGKYRLLKKLGEGGMGAVYHAQDLESGNEVALKVLGSGCLSQPDAIKRFEKEARLLAAAKSPHIANLLEFGEADQTRFLVMEFVRGGDLRGLLNRQSTLEEPLALELIGDLCKALVTAHANGMIHRDIKPENMLLEQADGQLRPIVKLSDFGLARHIDQSESLQLTQTGAFLGTPYYMAPEQFTGAHQVSPATDVYAIGVTLFEILTGARPFTANDPIRLASAHCFEEPPELRQLNPLVSDATAALVQRMLAKNPGHRPPDASTVLEEILRLQSGDSSQFVVHPLLPTHQPEQLVTANFEWSLGASPAELWPYISNTDRINQSVGLQPAAYEIMTEPDGRVRRFGQFKLAGVKIRWEEHPFEWIEGQRFSILREFATGPFCWFMSDVELIPRADGGTDLKHRVKVLPRGFMGRILAGIELGSKSQRKLDQIYRRIDQTVNRKLIQTNSVDPFQNPPDVKGARRARLEQRLEKLFQLNVSTAVIDVIRDLLLNSSAQDLARLRPFAIANRFHLPESELAEAFMKAATVGLMTLHWDIICPTCRIATNTKGTLREIEQHANCSACQIKFNVDIGNSLELIFRIHPEIRAYDDRTYCVGGPGNFPHVVAQVRLSGSERLMVPLSLEPGSYVVRGPGLPYAIPVDIDAKQGVGHANVKLLPARNSTPLVSMRSGHQNVAIENFFPSEQLIRIERTLRRSEALTAAQVTNLPLFQSLFPDQSLKSGFLMEVATANFLAIRLDGLDETFDELGDVKTFSLIQDFWRISERCTMARGGAVVEQSDTGSLLSFSDPVTAIAAMRELVAALNANPSDRSLKVSGALHRGAAIVTTQRHQVKYFGAAINSVRNLALKVSVGQLLLTSEIWTDPAVAAELGDRIRLDESLGEADSKSWRQISLSE